MVVESVWKLTRGASSRRKDLAIKNTTTRRAVNTKAPAIFFLKRTHLPGMVRHLTRIARN